MRIFLSLFLISSITFAYIDMDIDGVDDSVDQCPNTPFMETVDINGCSEEALISQSHYDIIIGAAYSQIDYITNEKTDTVTSTLQVDYFQDNFSLQAVGSYYNSSSDTYDESGLNDTILAAYYLIPLSSDFRLRIGAGVILPTYDTSLNNNNMDYLASISATYALNKFNIFGAYSLTLINDDDVAGAQYQDQSAYSAGVGVHISPKQYMSVSYSQADSIYVNAEETRSVSLYNFYSIDTNWFTTFSYAYGLSDTTSDHYLALNLGYYF